MDLDVTYKILGIVGGILGVSAFVWRVLDTYKSYLHIDLVTEKTDAEFCLLKTTVENKGQKAKRIDYAILLIGPEAEIPVNSFNKLAPALKQEPIKNTNDLEYRKIESGWIDSGRGIIPLPFYYDENVDIADEKVSYTYPLSAESFQRNVPYAVRFFIFGEDKLHRSTQATIIFT